MNTEPDYIDRITLSLKRKHSKDELVASLIKIINEKDFEIGMLKSEVDHLTFELNKEIPIKDINKDAKVLARRDGLYNEKRELCKKLEKEITSMKRMRDDAISRAHSLQCRLDKILKT